VIFFKNNCLTSQLNLAYLSSPGTSYSQLMQHMDNTICYWLKSLGKHSVLMQDLEITRF